MVGEAGPDVVVGSGLGDYVGLETVAYHRVSVDCSFCRFTALSLAIHIFFDFLILLNDSQC